MKKGVQCIAQTVNRHQAKSCPSPEQVLQKLVNEKVMTSPCPKSARSPYASPRPVSIRVCTRREIERTLRPPESCERGLQKCGPPSDTGGTMFSRIVKNVAKSAMAAGLVYWTSAEGVWGDGQESEELYHRIMATVSPALEEAVDFEDMKLPHLENIKHDVLDAYNRSVLGVVGLLVGVPMMLKEKLEEILSPRDKIWDEKIPGQNSEIDDKKKSAI